MKRLLHLAAIAWVLAFSTTAAEAADTYVAEPPRNQEAVYDQAANVVVITATAPKYTEFDWETYRQDLLPYISYVVVERHQTGTPWGDDTEIGRVETVVPGEGFSFTDRDVAADMRYEYKLTCYVDQTRGSSSFVNIYTGVTPGALQAFSAKVASHTSTTVDFEVTAPVTSESGEALTGNCAIEIQEYSEWTYTTIHVLEDVAPGETRTWQHADRPLDTALHYRAFARMGSAGNGESSEVDVYIGLDRPGQPVDFLCVPDGDGARLTWGHAEAGARGGNFNPAETTYDIYRTYNDGRRELADSGVEGTEYLDNPGFEEACTITYSIVGVNDAGEGVKEAVHPAISFGKAATLPFVESFAGKQMAHLGWMFETSQDDEYYTYQAWEFPEYGYMFYFPDDSYVDIPAQDNDGGLASCKFYGYSPDGQTESLVSPAIDTEDVETLTISFYYFEVCADASANSVALSVSRDGGEWEELLSTTPEETVAPAWCHVEVPVTLDGEVSTVKFRIDAVRHDGPITNVYVDNIHVEGGKSGVDDVVTDLLPDEGDVDYYTLQGVRLPSRPQTPGVYVAKTGKTACKVVVK